MTRDEGNRVLFIRTASGSSSLWVFYVAPCKATNRTNNTSFFKGLRSSLFQVQLPPSKPRDREVSECSLSAFVCCDWL